MYTIHWPIQTQTNTPLYTIPYPLCPTIPCPGCPGTTAHRSLYIPPNNETDYLEELCQAITDLSTSHNQSTIWIGGDANLLDIDWSNSSITGNNYSIPINTAFVNVVYDICAEQVVTFPTCLENTLDIFITNRPTLVSKCTSMPGLCDQDIVLTDTNIIPLSQKQKKTCIPVEESKYFWYGRWPSSVFKNLHLRVFCWYSH